MNCPTQWRVCTRRVNYQKWATASARKSGHSLLRRASPTQQPLASFLYQTATRSIHNDGPKTPNPLLNPPATTRPPPLTLPERNPDESMPAYLFKVSKGYLRFYKDGVKNLWGNHKLLQEKIRNTPADDRPSIWKPSHFPRSFSRADWVLMWRVRHDLFRLPLFGLMLIVIGEWMALVVLYVDGVVPYTCRIPKQIFGSLEAAEHRRKAAIEELAEQYPHGVFSPHMNQSVARAHVLRSLHLSGTIWDRIGFNLPWIWQLKGQPRMAYLEGDDQSMIRDGGPLGLEYEELRIACAERGIDTLGKSETELRAWLGDWLRLVTTEDVAERRRRMVVLLLTKPEQWPEHRDFAVPDWEL